MANLSSALLVLLDFRLLDKLFTALPSANIEYVHVRWEPNMYAYLMSTALISAKIDSSRRALVEMWASFRPRPLPTPLFGAKVRQIDRASKQIGKPACTTVTHCHCHPWMPSYQACLDSLAKAQQPVGIEKFCLAQSRTNIKPVDVSRSCVGMTREQDCIRSLGEGTCARLHITKASRRVPTYISRV